MPLATGPAPTSGRAARSRAAPGFEDRAGRLGRDLLERLRGADHRGRGLDQLARECAEELAPTEVHGRGGDRRRRGRRRTGAAAGRDASVGVGARRRWDRSAGSVNRRASMRRSRSVLDDAGDAPALEPVAALEELELDQEREADDLALEPLDELDRPVDRAAGREQVVDDQDLLAGRIASRWISSVFEPYSRAYSTVIVSAGSLPSLRTGTSPAPSW